MRSINKNDIVWAFINLSRDRRNSMVFGVPYYDRATGELWLNMNPLKHISNTVPQAYNICADYPVYDTEGVYIGSYERGRLVTKEHFK